MSSTNTTLATLAGGFVPMLLKNVLSSRSPKLSLKSISFKGQIDEIIDDYRQYWPVLDLVVERDIPEEPEENEAIEEKEGMDEMESDKENIRRKESKAIGETVTKKQSVDNGKNDKGDDDQKKFEPIIIEDRLFLGHLHDDDDDQLVDLFIDLSVADTEAGWSIRGSTEDVNEDREYSVLQGELKHINNTNSYDFYPSA